MTRASNMLADVNSTIKKLRNAYPAARCALSHSNPLQLLIATILSAQCTDERVNLVTPALFARYPNAPAFASAKISDIETLVRSTGFYHNKARHIQGACRQILAAHAGAVPQAMDDLLALPGVARKTANVVLNTAFGQPTIAVDTHIFRVSNRTKIAPGKDVVAVEKGLEKFVAPEFKLNVHHWLILHGRYICVARTPKCPQCGIADLCEYRPKTKA